MSNSEVCKSRPMIPTSTNDGSLRFFQRKIILLGFIIGIQQLICTGATLSAFVQPNRNNNNWNPNGAVSWKNIVAKNRQTTIESESKSSNQSSSGAVQEFGNRNEIQLKRSQYWVIIVDDEESIRNGVGQYLFQEGYQVTACSDAQTALNICRSAHVNNDRDQRTTPKSSLPDAIVSDVRMPDIDGLQFLRILRSDPTLVAIPVVLLTAKSRTEDRLQGYKAGTDAYLPKPFDPEELLVMVDNVIARHEALNGDNVKVDDLRDDLEEIKELLLEKGGAGPGNGWVTENVFLTPAEKVVLEALCKGLMNKEIAAETSSSLRRVEQHLTSMYRKTKCSNRTELVRWAVSSGYVKI